jgi:hypothetical protein
MIEVTYDGEYPNTCSGTLIIKKDGKEIYNKQHCCSSTGSVWFDNDWNEHVECGSLIWNDKDKFSREIQDAVENVLSGCNVCCGGCI